MTRFLLMAYLLIVFGYSSDSVSHPLSRVAVTGASVTAGFGLTTPPIQEDLGAYR